MIAINGTPLDDQDRGQAILNTLTNSSEARVTVIRNNQQQDLTLNIAQVAQEAETASGLQPGGPFSGGAAMGGNGSAPFAPLQPAPNAGGPPPPPDASLPQPNAAAAPAAPAAAPGPVPAPPEQPEGTTPPQDSQ